MNDGSSTFRWTARFPALSRPAERLNRGLLAMAPWLDAALLLLFFLFAVSRFVLQPGIRISLPQGPFRDGLNPYQTAVAVVVAHGETEPPGEGREVAYVEDERFILSRPDHLKKLQETWTSAVRQSPDRSLLLQADPSVRHGTLALLLQVAAEAGFKEALIATRPSESARP